MYDATQKLFTNLLTNLLGSTPSGGIRRSGVTGQACDKEDRLPEEELENWGNWMN